MEISKKLKELWFQMRQETLSSKSVFSERRYLDKVKQELTQKEWAKVAMHLDRTVAKLPHHLNHAWNPIRAKPIVKAWLFARYELIFGKLTCQHCGNVDGPIFRKAKNSGFRFSALIKYCSFQCSKSSEETTQRRKDTCLNVYGVDNISKTQNFRNFLKNFHAKALPEFYKEIQTKTEVTKLIKYGSLQEATRKRIAKFKATSTHRYGGNSPMCSPAVQAKTIETNMRKRGVPNVSQDPTVMEKIVANTSWKRFSAKALFINGNHYSTLQGYEPDFLKWFYDTERNTQVLISHGLSIPYTYKKQKKYYHVDFHVKDEPTILEIKSEYTTNLLKAKMPGAGSASAMRAKFKAAISQGYNIYLAIWFPTLNDCFVRKGLLPSQAQLAREVTQWKKLRLQQ